MSKTRLLDRSQGKGIYEGDLKYGRKLGDSYIKGQDFPSADGNNQPVVPLTLVEKRDPRVWRKDKAIKTAKKHVDNSQHGINYVLKVYRSCLADMKLTVGKQRI